MSLARAATSVGGAARRVSAGRRARNGLAFAAIAFGTLIVLLPLFLIFFYLLAQGLASVNLAFFTQLPRPVGEPGGGMGQAILGSLVMIGIALAIGTVVGVGTGVFLSEFAEHRLAPVVRVMSDVLTGVPAIVVGLVIYGLVVRPMRTYSGLAGGIALGLIMIPIIVRATEEVLLLVPTSIREAGLAIGLPRWRVILSVVLPAARGGIVTGIMLAVARVAGEAAPLLFTALGNTFWSRTALEPMAALPLQVYQYATSPYEDQIRQAWAGALVLVVMIFAASVIARLATRRRY